LPEIPPWETQAKLVSLVNFHHLSSTKKSSSSDSPKGRLRDICRIILASSGVSSQHPEEFGDFSEKFRYQQNPNAMKNAVKDVMKKYCKGDVQTTSKSKH